MGNDHVTTFGPFTLDRQRLALTRDGEPVAIGNRGMVLLQTLLDADGETVGKAELLERAWPGVVVEEGNLAVQIGALRKALGGDAESVIVTVPRVGYRLVLPRAVNAAEAEPSGGPPLIAVLPFSNLSGDPDQSFFADGVVEDIITALSRFTQFAVVSRNSSFVYKDRAVDVRVAAKELGVRYVLEGSVRRSGDRVRVTAQLIDAERGSHIWAEKLDGAIADIFDFQDLITESVVGHIEPQIRKSEIERTRRKRPESLDAYELYLRASPMILGTDKSSYASALDMLHRAIELDPGYAPAYAVCAWGHEKRYTFGVPAPAGVDDKAIALDLAEKAVLLERDDAAVLAICGWMFLILGGDDDRGCSLADRAIELNPYNLTALNFASLSYAATGQTQRAMETNLRALHLSPGAPDAYWSMTNLAALHFFAEKFDEAVDWGLRAVAVNANWEVTWGILACAYAYLDRLDEARHAARRVLEIRPDITRSFVDVENFTSPREREMLRVGSVKAGLPDWSEADIVPRRKYAGLKKQPPGQS